MKYALEVLSEILFKLPPAACVVAGAESAGGWEVSVADSGIGLSESEQANIFQEG